METPDYYDNAVALGAVSLKLAIGSGAAAAANSAVDSFYHISVQSDFFQEVDE